MLQALLAASSGAPPRQAAVAQSATGPVIAPAGTATADRRALTTAVAGVAGVSIVGAAVTALLIRSGKKARAGEDRRQETDVFAEDPPGGEGGEAPLTDQLHSHTGMTSPAGVAWGGWPDGGGIDSSRRQPASRVRDRRVYGRGRSARSAKDRLSPRASIYTDNHQASGGDEVPVPTYIASHPRFGPAIQGLRDAGVVSRAHLRAVVAHVDALMRHVAALEYCDPTAGGAREEIMAAIAGASTARRKVMRRLVRLSSATGIPRVRETNKLIESSLQELLDEIRTGTEETLYNANLVMQDKLELDVFASAREDAGFAEVPLE